MALDERVLPYFANISDFFGGYSVVQSLLTQEEIEYILTFSGFIVFMKPWSEPLDLREHDYSPGTNFRIFNQNWEFVYEGRSESGYFGEKEAEVKILVDSPNASYLHIAFNTLQEPVCGMIWVCNQLNPTQVRKKIDEWKSEKLASRSFQTENEIFLDASGLAKTGFIKIYFVGRPWDSQLSLSEIEQDSKTITATQEVANTIVLYPERSGWYVVTHVIDNEPRVLIFEQTTGIGLRRLRFSKEGAFFLDFSNSELNAPLIHPSALPSQNSREGWFSSDDKIRINADLTYWGAEMKVKTKTEAVMQIEVTSSMFANTRSLCFMTYTPPPEARVRTQSTATVLV